MRLIDADALGIGKANREVFETPEYADGWNAAIEIINAASTIDAVPVVHGRWELGGDGKMHCCSCDKVPTNKILVGGHAILHIAAVKQIMKYCPNCGAKMDLEVDGDG